MKKKKAVDHDNGKENNKKIHKSEMEAQAKERSWQKEKGKENKDVQKDRRSLLLTPINFEEKKNRNCHFIIAEFFRRASHP